MNNKEITRLIENAKQTLNENRGSDMEDYLDGRLSAFEDIQELLKTETKAGKKGEQMTTIRETVKLGPQPTPDDFRIWKGTPSEFFKKAADDLKKHEEEEVSE